MPVCRYFVAGATVLIATCLVTRPVAARCVDEERPDMAADAAAAATAPAPASAPSPTDPRVTLQGLVREALQRSHAVGASRMLAEAAEFEIEEARAAKALQASLSGGLGPGGTRGNGVNEMAALQVRASLTVSQLLYDGGRTDRLTDWRTQIAESARQGNLSAREQLALSTVALALERSRFRQHVLVYGQYVRKMGCLVEALDTIVKADRGRASELVQAKKSLQQAELSQAQAQSQSRQIDIRLRRLVGDGLPGVEGLSTVLLRVPELQQLVADVEQSSEVAQISAQATAAQSYAQAVAAGAKPQLSWAVTGGARASTGGNSGNSGNSGNRGSGRAGDYSLGLTINVPLLSPGLAPASSAAQKRADAAAAQRAEAVEARRFRVAEVHEQTLASFDRLRRAGALLRDTDQLRNFTLQQWQQLGRRSLFDVMATEGEHYNLRISYVNALHDGQQLNALLLSLGRGVNEWLR